MRLEHADLSAAKGWYLGPWNSALAVSIGFGTRGMDEPHLHRAMSEVYLVARGTARVRVDQETLVVAAGDVLVVEPGEPHTFLDSSPDYFHFVLAYAGVVRRGGRRRPRGAGRQSRRLANDLDQQDPAGSHGLHE